MSDATKRSTVALGLWVAIAGLVIDQASKYWVIHVYDLEGRGGQVTVTSFFDLRYAINPGISYGLFEQNHGFGQWLLSSFAVAVSIGLIVWLRTQTRELKAVAIGLIIGGALANAIDRPIYGGVADFIQLHAFGFYWYIFNLADAWIVAGVAGLLYDSIFENRKKAAKTA
ncbi:MAG: signal peptidase II [Hyphomicrobiaceae bacterium]